MNKENQSIYEIRDPNLVDSLVCPICSKKNMTHAQVAAGKKICFKCFGEGYNRNHKSVVSSSGA